MRKEGAVMRKPSVTFEEVKKQLMEDDEFKAEYENLKPRHDVISQITETRKEIHITQEELAKRAGTQKSNISRLESGSYNPSYPYRLMPKRMFS